MICRDVCPDNHVTKVPFLVTEIVTPLRPSIPDIGRRGTMTTPGLSAESPLYRTSEYNHTVGTFEEVLFDLHRRMRPFGFVSALPLGVLPHW